MRNTNSKYIRVLVLLTIPVVLNLGIAQAAYKCVGVDGRVTYSDTPCAGNAKQSEVSGVQNKPRGSGIKRVELDAAPTVDEVKQCLDAWRPSMRDPQSLYSQNAVAHLVTNQDRPDVKPWKEVVLSAHAKNGFGGYNAIQLNCPLSADGTIDTKAVKGYQAMRTLGVDPK